MPENITGNNRVSETKQNKLEKYKPAVTTDMLLLIAGVVWLGTGILLISMAATWLAKTIGMKTYLFMALGVILAMPIHHFGFLKIERILQMQNKRCLFSFVPWKSYMIIVIMIAMGITLRHSTIPKHYLAIIYLGIGLALTLSSIRYIRIRRL